MKCFCAIVVSSFGCPHLLPFGRDALLATLVDGVRASGNEGVLVSGWPGQWGRGRRVGPLGCPPDEDVEASYLRMLHTPPAMGACTGQGHGVVVHVSL